MSVTSASKDEEDRQGGENGRSCAGKKKIFRGKAPSWGVLSRNDGGKREKRQVLARLTYIKEGMGEAKREASSAPLKSPLADLRVGGERKQKKRKRGRVEG